MKSQTELNFDSTIENESMSADSIESYLRSMEEDGKNHRRSRERSPVGHGGSRNMRVRVSGQADGSRKPHGPTRDKWVRSRDIDSLYIKSEVEAVA